MDLNELTEQQNRELANNPNTPPETLTVLASDNDSNVRYFVAQNPNTPPKTLNLLANDKDRWVRWRVADNPNTSPETLTFLSNDEYLVSYMATRNPNTPQYVKEYLIARNFMSNYGF